MKRDENKPSICKHCLDPIDYLLDGWVHRGRGGASMQAWRHCRLGWPEVAEPVDKGVAVVMDEKAL